MAGITLNPMATTNAAGLFNTQSAGYTQGDALDDPAIKFALAGGFLAVGQNPIYGGIPVEEQIGAGNSLTNSILAATNLATTTGICVFNQAFQGIVTPQSEVPLYQPGMSVHFYRLGSGARIPLRCNPAIINSLPGELITQQLSWDYTNLWITTYDGSNVFPVKIIDLSTSGNLTVAYSGGSANWLTTENVVVCQI